MYCPNCGKQNADNSAFCGWCGASLKQFVSNNEKKQEGITQQPSKQSLVKDQPVLKKQESSINQNLKIKQDLKSKNKVDSPTTEEGKQPAIQPENSSKNVKADEPENNTPVEENKKSSKWIWISATGFILIVAVGIWFFLNSKSTEESDPAAIPQAAYASPLLQGLNACGQVYKIEFDQQTFFFNREGKCIDGVTSVQDSYDLSLGEPRGGQVNISVENGHITWIEYITAMTPCPEVGIKFTDYDALGLPTKADLMSNGDIVASEVKVKCTDFDSYGNWTRILIAMPDSSDSNELIAYFPSEITRTIEYWKDGTADLVALPTDSELELLLKLANKLDRTAISNELATLREQAQAAPCNVWDGGFEYYDLNDELFFGGEETPNQFRVVTLKKHPNYEQSEFFAYIRLEGVYDNDYSNTSDHLVYFIVEDGRWKINDVDNTPANEYFGEHSLKEELKSFINQANEDIVSGKIEREVKENFSHNEEQMNQLLTEISDYRSKYNI